jgi:hypothetical protein
MEENKKWFYTGEEGVKWVEQKDIQNQARQEARGNRRFFQPKNSSTRITFLDDPNFFCSEHNLQLNGKWGNFFTCCVDYDDCVLCAHGYSSCPIVTCSVIDHSSYTDRNDKVHSFQKRLFVAKRLARSNLLRQLAKKKSLVNWLYEVARGGDKNEPATGSDFEAVKQVDRKKLAQFIVKKWRETETMDTDTAKKRLKELFTPFNYEKIFALKSSDALRKIIGVGAPTGSGADSAALEMNDIDNIDNLLI